MADIEVTDPKLLKQLNAEQEVTDPELLRRLNGENTTGDTALGLAKAAGTGLVKGTAELLGMPGDVRDLAKAGAKKLLPEPAAPTLNVGDKPIEGTVNVGTGEPAAPAGGGWYGSLVRGLETARGALELPTGQELKDAAAKMIPMHKAEGFGERLAENAGEFVPGAAIVPEAKAGNYFLNLMRYGALPGVTSEAVGEGAHKAIETNKYTKDLDPRIKGAIEGTARIGTALATPGAAAKIISPNAEALVSEGGQRAMNQKETLNKAGVDVTSGDVQASVTGDNSRKNIESELNPEIGKRQEEQFTKAAVAPLLDTGVVTIGKEGNLNEARKAIGDQYDTILGRNDFQSDNKTIADLSQIKTDLTALPLHDPGPVKNITDTIDHIADVLVQKQGQMTGQEYQTMRSRIREEARSTEDSVKARALNKIADALDSSFERGLQTAGSPDAGAIGPLNQKYKHLLTIEDARVRQGKKYAEGNITPSALQSAAKRIYGEDAYQAGNTPFTDLAESGAAMLTPRPDSGTPGRTAVREKAHQVAESIASPIGYLTGSHFLGGGSEGGVGGLLLSHAVTPLVEPFVKAGMRATNGSTGPGVIPTISAWRQFNTALAPNHAQETVQRYIRALQGAHGIPMITVNKAPGQQQQ